MNMASEATLKKQSIRACAPILNDKNILQHQFLNTSCPKKVSTHTQATAFTFSIQSQADSYWDGFLILEVQALKANFKFGLLILESHMFPKEGHNVFFIPAGFIWFCGTGKLVFGRVTQMLTLQITCQVIWHARMKIFTFGAWYFC